MSAGALPLPPHQQSIKPCLHEILPVAAKLEEKLFRYHSQAVGYSTLAGGQNCCNSMHKALYNFTRARTFITTLAALL